MEKSYAGIGSRETPAEILMYMTQIASLLESKGYTLFSGGASGADTAFESGVSNPENKKIFLPWEGFNDNKSDLYKISRKAVRIAKEYHPTWDYLPKNTKLLIARNGYQVLGESLSDPVDMVICYTSDGRAKGGTGQAIRIANHYKIPVFNLQDKKHLKQVLTWIETGEISYIKDVRFETWKLM